MALVRAVLVTRCSIFFNPPKRIENLEFPFALQHLNHRCDLAVSLTG
nr:MAG TPA: hypothetical protein [Caudoviricetes sp.]